VNVFDRMSRLAVVPVLTARDAAQAESACRALVAGGLTAVEITFRTDAAVESIRRASEIDGLLVGAGTVRTVEQLSAAIDAGASFAVAPAGDPAVVAEAARAGLPFVPGAATPTEIARLQGLGCDVIKLFPASILGGPAFVKAVSAVFPEVQFMPTGGVTAANVHEYLALPSVLACGGTWICDPQLLRESRFDEVERRAREAAGLKGAAA
jgi:2-dehydro-3-deoxyphosphogluconate aldolase/(4S)-4-hydroxy-2-oxoglutarate aldolase